MSIRAEQYQIWFLIKEVNQLMSHGAKFKGEMKIEIEK
jgi:hypothetical protein